MSMLTSLLGVRALLLTGATVPTPPPPSVTAALRRVRVTNDSDRGDGFQITFAMGKGALDYDVLTTGALATFNRVIVGVVLGIVPEVLIDGIITHHQVSPTDQAGESTLTVTGRDVSVMMDLEERNAEYPNQPDFAIAAQRIATYAQYGMVPMTTPTTDIPIQIDRVPRQAETDLRFIDRLAERNGFVFYVEPVTFGVNNAYFGPEIRAGVPQSALTLNMGSRSNVDRLNFTQDALAPEGTTGSFLEPMTKTTLPIPALPSLRVPPLSLMPAPARRTRINRSSANESATRAAVTAVASATNQADAVTASGTLDTVRYGSVLRARKLVGVRGAGYSYDGFYYVRRVTHVLERGQYTQEFSISREGTGAILPVVTP